MIHRAFGVGLAAFVVGACGAQDWSFDPLRDASTSPEGETGVDAPADAADAPLGDGADDEPAEAEAGRAIEAGISLEASPPCGSDDDCPFLTPVCQSSGQCTACIQDTDCAAAAGGPACDTSTGACVPCTSSADCASHAGVTHCDTTTHTCVACLESSDCPRESSCDLASHTCTPSI